MLDERIVSKLNEEMQLGYSYMMKHDSVAACNEWGKVWEDILMIMNSGEYEGLEDLDDKLLKFIYSGRRVMMQFILNWVSDYDMELSNAAIKDITFAQKRISFCSDYIKLISDKEGLNTYNMRRAMAESYFKLGEKDKGEELFKNYLDEKPTWGWGWIGWSDMYWMFVKSEDRDNEKAISILKQALEVEGIEDKSDVQERLRDLYNEIGMDEEAKKIVINKRRRKNPIARTIKPETVVAEPKVGRNDPCPCGSGKKYKKCCMD